MFEFTHNEMTTLGDWQEQFINKCVDWVEPSTADIRDTITKNHIVAITSPPEDLESPWRFIDGSKQIMTNAVSDGCLFGVSALLSGVIIKEGSRAKNLFLKHYIHHPYRKHYVIAVPSPGGPTTIYIVGPDEVDKMKFKMAIATTCIFNSRKIISLMCGGEVIVTEKEYNYNGIETGVMSNTNDRETKYPFNMHFDLIMVVLSLLATDGVSVNRFSLTDRQIKDRKLMKLKPKPPYWEVDSLNYITALGNRYSKENKHLGGTHAPPIMHLRRGHPRTLHNGNIIWVRDTIVNAKGESLTCNRMFYEQRKENNNGN